MKESATYHIIEREEWMEFYQNSVAPLTKEELEQLKGLNDQISLRDVEDVYIPIAHLFDIYLTQYEALQEKIALFKKRSPKETLYHRDCWKCSSWEKYNCSFATNDAVSCL